MTKIGADRCAYIWADGIYSGLRSEKAFELFIETSHDKYPKATLSLQKDREELLAFYDFPAKHWQSIRTSNPIESTFGTILDIEPEELKAVSIEMVCCT